MSEVKSTFFTNRDLIICLSFSLGFILFLGFIDEGYYSFESFTKTENIIPFVLYLIIALAGQLLMARFLAIFMKQSDFRSWMSAIVGALLFIGVFIFILLATT